MQRDSREGTADESPRFVTMRPRKRVSRSWLSKRRMHACRVAVASDSIVILPTRGATVTAIDANGEVVIDREYDSTVVLRANRGDGLMLWGSSALDEIALVRVEMVVPVGWSESLRCAPVAGKVTSATAKGFVAIAGKAARPKRRPL